MKRSVRALSSLLAGSVVVASALAGCSSAPSEDAASSHQAYTYDEAVSLTATQFNTLVTTFVQPGSAGFTTTNNVATFTSSPGMENLGFPAQIQATIPVETESAGICGTATITVPSLTLASPITVTLGAAGISIDTTVNGSANAHTSGVLCPNPTFGFSNVPVHAELGTSNGNLIVTAAQITLTGHTSDSCGVLDWCGGLVSGYIGDAQNAINSLLLSTLSGQLSSTTVQTSIDSAIIGEEASVLGLQGAAMVPGSLVIANSTIGNTISFSAAPPTLVCSGTGTCSSSGYTADGFATITCNPLSMVGGFDISLERQVNGAWQTEQTTLLETPGFGATLTDSYPTNGSLQTLTYRVCSSDSSGTACGATFTVESVSSCSCEPMTCAAQGAQCGSASNACGGTQSCGTCAAGETCSSNRCCPTGEVWNTISNTCSTHPGVCPKGEGDCGGFCCRCGPNDPC
jgi:hypothetical protein